MVTNIDPYQPAHLCTPIKINNVNTLSIHYVSGLCRPRSDRQVIFYLDHTMRKLVFRHMWTTKAQIRLRICAVWSGPSLSANRIIRHYTMYEWRAKAQGILCACTGWTEFAQFAHVQMHFFAWYGPFALMQTAKNWTSWSISSMTIVFTVHLKEAWIMSNLLAKKETLIGL